MVQNALVAPQRPRFVLTTFKAAHCVVAIAGLTERAASNFAFVTKAVIGDFCFGCISAHEVNFTRQVSRASSLCSKGTSALVSFAIAGGNRQLKL